MKFLRKISGWKLIHGSYKKISQMVTGHMKSVMKKLKNIKLLMSSKEMKAVLHTEQELMDGLKTTLGLI